MNEELKKQQEAEAKAATEKAVADATAALKKDLADKEAELKKLQDKDFNFNKVVTSEKEKEAQLVKAQEDIKTLNAKIVEVQQAPLNQARDGLIGVLAGADPKVKEALTKEFERFGKDAKSVEEVEKAVKDAYLSVTGRPVDSRDAARASSMVGYGGRRVAPVNSPSTVDPEVKGLAENFNKNIADPKKKITDDDIKKYPVKPGQSAESAK